MVSVPEKRNYPFFRRGKIIFNTWTSENFPWARRKSQKAFFNAQNNLQPLSKLEKNLGKFHASALKPPN